MQSVSLHDLVTVEPGADGVDVRCQGWDVPQGEENICYRAATAILALLDMERSGVSITVEKHIPPGAGLGGGSADAAAVILGLPQVLGQRVTDLEALDLAEAVGADVPFFLTGGTALVTGIGQRVQPLARACQLHFALAQPEVGVETGWAYQLYDACGSRGASQESREGAACGASARLQAALAAGDVAAVADGLANDFWGPLSRARPELAALSQAVTATGALGVGLTGSGSCFFGIYETEADAAKAATELSAQGYWCASTVAVDCGVADLAEGAEQALRLGTEAARE